MQVNLHCRDVGAVFDYLVNVLGFTPEFRASGVDGHGTMFASASWGEVGTGPRIILGDIAEALHGHYDHGEFGRQLEEHPLGTGVVFYFTVDDVDQYYSQIVGRGAQIDEPPTDQFWGERTISVLVPEGFYFTFAKPIPGFQMSPELARRLVRFPRN